ncbi:hypothetical protein BHE74_00017813 [Ensete ventricosum]|nr:hypothetical protein BHE74_00017813 [Ensete ventricosum]
MVDFWWNRPVAGDPRTGNLTDRYVPPYRAVQVEIANLGANTIGGGEGPTMCWQRPHMERSWSDTTHSEMSREGHYHTKRLREPDKSKDKVEQANVATKEAKKNRIDVSPNTEVLKQMVERGEKATTSPEGLSYPKAKRRSEKRWTRRSATVSQRRTYRSQRKGRRCKATDSRAMDWQRHDTAEAGLP